MLVEPVMCDRFLINDLQPVGLMFKVTKACCMSQCARRDLIALSCQDLKHAQIICCVRIGLDHIHCLLSDCQDLQYT